MREGDILSPDAYAQVLILFSYVELIQAKDSGFERKVVLEKKKTGGEFGEGQSSSFHQMSSALAGPSCPLQFSLSWYCDFVVEIQ